VQEAGDEMTWQPINHLRVSLPGPLALSNQIIGEKNGHERVFIEKNGR